MPVAFHAFHCMPFTACLSLHAFHCPFSLGPCHSLPFSAFHYISTKCLLCLLKSSLLPGGKRNAFSTEFNSTNPALLALLPPGVQSELGVWFSLKVTPAGAKLERSAGGVLVDLAQRLIESRQPIGVEVDGSVRARSMAAGGAATAYQEFCSMHEKLVDTATRRGGAQMTLGACGALLEADWRALDWPVFDESCYWDAPEYVGSSEAKHRWLAQMIPLIKPGLQLALEAELPGEYLGSLHGQGKAKEFDAQVHRRRRLVRRRSGCWRPLVRSWR